MLGFSSNWYVPSCHLVTKYQTVVRACVWGNTVNHPDGYRTFLVTTTNTFDQPIHILMIHPARHQLAIAHMYLTRICWSCHVRDMYLIIIVIYGTITWSSNGNGCSRSYIWEWSLIIVLMIILTSINQSIMNAMGFIFCFISLCDLRNLIIIVSQRHPLPSLSLYPLPLFVRSHRRYCLCIALYCMHLSSIILSCVTIAIRCVSNQHNDDIIIIIDERTHIYFSYRISLYDLLCDCNASSILWRYQIVCWSARFSVVAH